MSRKNAPLYQQDLYKIKSLSITVPAFIIAGDLPVLVIATVPFIVTFLSKKTSPLIVRDSQPTREGMPSIGNLSLSKSLEL